MYTARLSRRTALSSPTLQPVLNESISVRVTASTSYSLTVTLLTKSSSGPPSEELRYWLSWKSQGPNIVSSSLTLISSPSLVSSCRSLAFRSSTSMVQTPPPAVPAEADGPASAGAAAPPTSRPVMPSSSTACRAFMWISSGVPGARPGLRSGGVPETDTHMSGPGAADGLRTNPYVGTGPGRDRRTASTRFPAPSLASTWETCTPAVFSLMTSWRAIWRLVRPRHSRSRTSRSR